MRQPLLTQTQEAQRTYSIVVRGPSDILKHDLTRSFLSSDNACKSDFLLCVSYDIHFIFVLHPCHRSIQYSALKKASYQGVMIIKVPFVLICVSVALLSLSKVMREGMQVISKQISNNCFLFTHVASKFVQTCKTTHPNVANLSDSIVR